MKKKALVYEIFLLFFIFLVILVFFFTYNKVYHVDLIKKTIVEGNTVYLDKIVFSNFEYSDKKLHFCANNLGSKKVLFDNEYYIENSNINIPLLGSLESNESACYSYDVKKYEYNLTVKNSTNIAIKVTDEMKDNYSDCLLNKFGESNNIKKLKNELTNYLKKYNVSIAYEDINENINYYYNENKVYYGASLIKLPVALYIIEEVQQGNKSLDDEIKLNDYYYKYAGKELKKINVNSNLKVRDYIYYMLTYSDNGAYYAMYDYIDKKGLIEFEKSLGVKTTFALNTDKFGSQSAKDMLIYLRQAYEIILNYNEYGNLLRESMINPYDNRLLLDDGIKIAHKFGYVKNKYHDVGIVYNNNPYMISILSLYDLDVADSLFKNIHGKIKNINDTYYSEKNDFCLDTTYVNL